MTDSPAASAEVLAHQIDVEGVEPLLLLNGGMMSFAAWESVAAPLRAVETERGSKRYRLVGCDFRGQLSSPGVSPEDLTTHAADVAALLHHLDLGPVHVIGASFGGLVGVELAAAHPELVRSLVVATAAIRADEAMDAGTNRMIELIRNSLAGGDFAFGVDLVSQYFNARGGGISHGRGTYLACSSYTGSGSVSARWRLAGIGRVPFCRTAACRRPITHRTINSQPSVRFVSERRRTRRRPGWRRGCGRRRSPRPR
jgi:pimeloyl-ACP methyl ester carboxylesterase